MFYCMFYFTRDRSLTAQEIIVLTDTQTNKHPETNVTNRPYHPRYVTMSCEGLVTVSK